MNKRHYEHTLPNIRGSLSNTYDSPYLDGKKKQDLLSCLFFSLFHTSWWHFNERPFLSKKETLREINLYNSVIQAVENVFHIAWKE